MSVVVRMIKCIKIPYQDIKSASGSTNWRQDIGEDRKLSTIQSKVEKYINTTRKAWDRYDKYAMEADMKWLPIFRDAGVEIINFPAEERAKILEKAEGAWEEWVKDMESKGLPGREILDFALAKRDEVMAKK